MRKAIWAIYFHKLSTEEEPCHYLCPPKGPGKTNWCKYNINPDAYKHHGLPAEVMAAIKPIFRDLSNPELLRKCFHGKTQNCNESFNNLVWIRIPKRVFVGLQTLKIGVLDAIVCYNGGNIGRVKVLQELKINPGYNTMRYLQAMDTIGVEKAEKAVEDLTKQARKKKKKH